MGGGTTYVFGNGIDCHAFVVLLISYFDASTECLWKGCFWHIHSHLPESGMVLDPSVVVTGG